MTTALKRMQVSGDLFAAVQSSGIFEDCKTFVDCYPKTSPEQILQAFKQCVENGVTDLKTFVNTHFHVPPSVTEVPEHDHYNMHHYIQLVWQVLQRQPVTGKAHDTLIPLPEAYIVPGGRFREIYYWDSYFTATGLVADGHTPLVESMVKNFAYLIRQFGHVPNGNRVYYLSRSQPPLFGFMLDLLEQQLGTKAVLGYVDALETEYHYWMKGLSRCQNKPGAADHVVSLGDGHFLNRYWDPVNEPRPEAYREDLHTYNKASEANKAQLYHHIRAACESGWDFSSRWLADEENLTSIRTADIIPVDLNAYLYFIERKLAHYQQALEQSKKVDKYCQAADARLQALNQFCWNQDKGFYFDYCWTEGKQTNTISAAGLTPLFVRAASQEQADRVAKFTEQHLLKTGGIVTSCKVSGQQWDQPNGWAPLQWIAVDGLRHYDHNDLARTIAQRWLGLNQHIFQQTGIMLEKYNVCEASPKATDGEYQLQFGFGWTNGVASALMAIFEEDLSPTS